MTWIEDLGLDPGTTITAMKIKEAARIKRDSIKKKLEAITKLAIDSDGVPIVEKEVAYFRELATSKYPNQKFLEHLDNIRTLLTYFELKNELFKIGEAEREGVLEIFDVKIKETRTKEEKPKPTITVNE